MPDSTNRNKSRRRSKLCSRLAAFLAYFLLSSPGLVFAADFEQGLQSFRAGDIQSALKQWQPLAQAGDADAQHAMGMMHEYGHVLNSSDQTAAIWYKKAAEQGVSEAQYRLGVFHENGWGVPHNAQMAAQWYQLAAQRGHVFAQHDLAYMHLNGEGGLPPNGIQAYKWLKIASFQRPDLMTKHLINVSKTLNAKELKEAEKLADAWLNSQKI